jgi:hypothetical protein
MSFISFLFLFFEKFVFAGAGKPHQHAPDADEEAI